MFHFWTCFTCITCFGTVYAFHIKRKLPQTRLYRITCSKMKDMHYNLIFTTKFNDSSIWTTIISWDYLNLSLVNEYVGDVTIPTMVIKYNKCCSKGISQSDCSIHIKLNYVMICAVITQLSNVKVFYRPNKYIIDCLAIVYYREIMKICRF